MRDQLRIVESLTIVAQCKRCGRTGTGDASEGSPYYSQRNWHNMDSPRTVNGINVLERERLIILLQQYTKSQSDDSMDAYKIVILKHTGWTGRNRGMTFSIKYSRKVTDL